MRPASARRGVATVEMALVAPIVLLLIAGTVDVVRHLRAHLRVETAAVQIAQIVSQCTRINAPGDTDRLWSYGQAVAGNIVDLRSTNGTGAIVVSAISMVGNAPQVRWQQRSGNPTYSSRFGTPGNTAILSDNMTVPAGQTLFAVEVTGASQAWVFGSGMMGSLLGQLTGVTMYLSRATDPTQLQAAPTNSTARACT